MIYERTMDWLLSMLLQCLDLLCANLKYLSYSNLLSRRSVFQFHILCTGKSCCFCLVCVFFSWGRLIDCGWYLRLENRLQSPIVGFTQQNDKQKTNATNDVLIFISHFQIDSENTHETIKHHFHSSPAHATTLVHHICLEMHTKFGQNINADTFVQSHLLPNKNFDMIEAGTR